jgi:hypothetical protein
MYRGTEKVGKKGPRVASEGPSYMWTIYNKQETTSFLVSKFSEKSGLVLIIFPTVVIT